MLGFSAGRALAFVVAGWLGLVLVAWLSAMLPTPRAWLPLVAPDFALLVVLFLGLSGRGTLVGVCVVAAAIGYLADLFAGSPKGVHILAFTVLALLARPAARLLLHGRFATALFALFYTVALGVFIFALRWVSGAYPGLALLRRLPYEALSSALFAPLVFRSLARLDRLFQRDGRTLPA